MKGYNNIFEIIEKSNDEQLKKYFYDRPKYIISEWDTRSKLWNKITLSSVWTFNLLKWAFKCYFSKWKKFFRNWLKDSNGEPVTPINMTKEEKEYFGYDLNKIDFEKINNLNKYEIKFILDNLINTSRNAVILIDNMSVNINWLKFQKKEKRIRNPKLIQDKLLKNVYIKNNWNNYSTNIFENNTKYLNDKQKILKQDFQSWIIDELRKKSIEIPDIENLKTKEEMEVEITKNIYKFI